MATFHDLKDMAVFGLSNPPAAAVTADVTTGATAVDCQLMEGTLTAIVAAGATDFASTDEVYAFALYESAASGGTYTAISGATGSITAANTVLVIRTDKRSMRYVKLYLDVSGTTPSIIYSGTVMGRRKIVGSGDGSYSA